MNQPTDRLFSDYYINAWRKQKKCIEEILLSRVPPTPRLPPPHLKFSTYSHVVIEATLFGWIPGLPFHSTTSSTATTRFFHNQIQRPLSPIHSKDDDILRKTCLLLLHSTLVDSTACIQYTYCVFEVPILYIPMLLFVGLFKNKLYILLTPRACTNYLELS